MFSFLRKPRISKNIRVSARYRYPYIAKENDKEIYVLFTAVNTGVYLNGISIGRVSVKFDETKFTRCPASLEIVLNNK